MKLGVRKPLLINRLVIISTTISIFFGCNTSSNESAKVDRYNDSLVLAGREAAARVEFIADSIYKTTPEYKLKQKKIAKLELKKDKIKDKYQNIVDDCYGWTTLSNRRNSASSWTFNLTKFEEIMTKRGFKRGENTGDFEGEDGSFIVRIHYGGAVPSSSGWQHKWDIFVDINEDKIK